MGAYYLIVNPAKRQYLDPARFGEAVKFSSVLRGDHCLLALKLLIADHPQEGAVRAGLQGAWVGDPIVLACDDYGQPNAGGIVTVTVENPERNLSQMAHEEFTNITYRAIAELCRQSDIIEQLIAKARQNKSFFIDLVNVMMQYHPAGVEFAIQEAFGKAWRREYDRALREAPWWHPLPPLEVPS